MAKKIAKTLMIQGTGSGVGKSVIVAGLCRIFKEDGFKVAPFKAQNMALNSFVTKDGKEMGRAQVMQAEAAGLAPSCDMNPILIKPNTDTKAQVIVLGKPVGNMNAVKYKTYKQHLRGIVKKAFYRLRSKYDIIVIEGAGSPAEINLKKDDLVNMNFAKQMQSPVILVGDIDKGGVFAWLIGTLSLLDSEEQDLTKGFIINKFRGDKRLLRSGVKFLEQETHRSVFGIVPYFKNILLDEEDSLPLELAQDKNFRKKDILVEVLYLPHISNFTDFEPLRKEGDVSLRYVMKGQGLTSPDLIIIPGTKSTISDLKAIKKAGYAKQIKNILKRKKDCVLLGICGGFQMLGEQIIDPYGVESSSYSMDGLGLLSTVTRFKKQKKLNQIETRISKNRFFGDNRTIKGYEIHMGDTRCLKAMHPFSTVVKKNAKRCYEDEGAISNDGKVMGTYSHGLFDNALFRRSFVNYLRKRKGLMPRTYKKDDNHKEKQYKKIATLLRKNLDMKKIYGLINAK